MVHENQKPTSNECELFHSFNLYLPTRTIYFGGKSEDEGEVSSVTVSQVIKNLTILEHREIAPISLILLTSGGEWEAGMALYDVIKSLKSKVNILGIGKVYSMGSIILQAGYKRVLSPNSTLMIHDGSDGFFGHPKDFESWASYSKICRNQMYNILFDRMKKKDKSLTLAKVEQLCSFDKIYSASDAINAGLVDSILGYIRK